MIEFLYQLAFWLGTGTVSFFFAMFTYIITKKIKGTYHPSDCEIERIIIYAGILLGFITTLIVAFFVIVMIISTIGALVSNHIDSTKTKEKLKKHLFTDVRVCLGRKKEE